MEEIEVFSGLAESPTGERIKLFLEDDLDVETPIYDLPLAQVEYHPLDLPRCLSPGIEFDEDSGQEVQRISVINNVPDLLRDSHAECMRRVVPKVREVLHVAQAEMQLAASTAFLQILQKELVPIQNYTQTFLQTILSSIDSKDPDVANAWLETLLDVIDLLPKDVIKKEILTIAIDKGQLTQPVSSRLSCCKILGKISTKFEPFLIKKEILPVVQSLCQDVDYEVRECMCRQLDPVARGLGLDATKSAILPELVELTNDEESYVRIAGIETVVNILTLVDEDVCKNTLIPLVCKICQESLQADNNVMLPVVAMQLGQLCHGFSNFLTDDQKQWFIDFFKKLCKVGLSEKSKVNAMKDMEKESPTKEGGELPVQPDMLEKEHRFIETRKNCAFNFPAMVVFIVSKSFKSDLGNVFSSLSKDPNVLVRKTLASGFHEIAKTLGSYVHFILNEFILLLHDETIDVLRGLISNLPDILSCLMVSQGNLSDTKLNAIAEVIPAILTAEVVISASNDWRLQEELMRNLVFLQDCTSSENIYNKVIPVLFNKLRTARALPVRQAAVRTTLTLIRNLKKTEQREELLQMLIDDFCCSRSCHHRNLFIDMCKVTIELYSKAFFKEHFFEPLIQLHLDPVPNVRLRLCSVLPDLRRLIKLPTDRVLLQQLEACVRKLLIGEKDRDVQAAIKQAVEELDKIPYQMESHTRRMYMEEDIDDKKKEDEEKRLIELEDKELKKEEDARSVKGEKGRSGSFSSKKDNGGSKIPGPKKGSKANVKQEKEKEKEKDKERSSSGVKRTPSTTAGAVGTTTSTKDLAQNPDSSSCLSGISSLGLGQRHIPANLQNVFMETESKLSFTAYIHQNGTTSPETQQGILYQNCLDTFDSQPGLVSQIQQNGTSEPQQSRIPQKIQNGLTYMDPQLSRIPQKLQNGLGSRIPSPTVVTSSARQVGEQESKIPLMGRPRGLSRANSDVSKRKSTSMLAVRAGSSLAKASLKYCSQPDLLLSNGDSSSSKTGTKTSSRSGTSGVPAPSSAGAGGRKNSGTNNPPGVQARRGSLSGASTGSEASVTSTKPRKSSNGSIPSTSSKTKKPK
ncbi:hypothetical protein CHS0354_029090 [Potamilus streckersoni]|uniref:Serine/threonine-protein phosphatase 4 regulatory subunit 4 n=1 Tax=Potamilus streckersoni TaxID=2493646 RepID=A0AAE0SWS5_9BIVA|nr:hypothetical protein CHS0354_029090 [Potamilus streckersoni]